MGYPPRPIAPRFWSKVWKSEGCWTWKGGRDKNGYGKFCVKGKNDTKAHRVAYELVTGMSPGALHVLHRCDNPPCVRPDHLFLGTHADNMADMHTKGKYYGRETPRGSQHGMAKLSEGDVIDIRTLRALGARVMDLASAFGIRRSHVSRIIHYDTWKTTP